MGCYAMLEQFFMPAFKRQKEILPAAIETLERVSQARQLTRSTVLALSQVSHDLRNQLTVVSVVLEFNEIKEDATQKP